MDARNFRSIALVAMLVLEITGDLHAQTLGSLGLDKTIAYVQTSASTVEVENSGIAYSFNAYIFGSGLASLSPAPTLSGPFGGSPATMTYSAAGGDRWDLHGGYPSAAARDAAFGSGIYTITVNATSVPVQLTGDAYPNPPMVSFSQGSWVGGKLRFDPSRPLTITTNAFDAYSATNGVIFLGDVTQGFFENPVNSVSVTLPANTYADGADVNLNLQFSSWLNKNSTAIPGTFAGAGYASRTSVPLKAAAPQVFPLTVTSNITPTVSNATATFQPRPQDVGTTASVYVFAVAPSTVVMNAAAAKTTGLSWAAKGATADTPVQCLLAQLNSSGQLQAVSASNLAAYVTGTLGAQGQSVSLLANVPTPNIAGATFYLGYGTSAQQMIASGVNQRALSVAATTVRCDPEAPQTGWWWNSAEGGRGYSIELSGNTLLFASYLYDVSGRSTWLLSSGHTSVDGSLFTSQLESYAGGQTLAGSYKAPNPVVYGGALTLAFSDAKHGTMVWPGGSVPIERFNIVPNGITMSPMNNQPETGWWWNPSESGRGYFLEWQGGELFMAGYMYDDAGSPIWHLSSNTSPSSNLQSYTNTWWQYANGQTLTGAYKPATQVNNNVGPVSITFQGAENAIMTLPGGRTTAIRRFRF